MVVDRQPRPNFILHLLFKTKKKKCDVSKSELKERNFQDYLLVLLLRNEKKIKAKFFPYCSVHGYL